MSKGGGGYKIPAAWGLKIYTPTRLPLKMPSGQKWGEGGVYIINITTSPWKIRSVGAQHLILDAAFLLAVGSFLLTVEFSTYN